MPWAIKSVISINYIVKHLIHTSVQVCNGLHMQDRGVSQPQRSCDGPTDQLTVVPTWLPADEMIGWPLPCLLWLRLIFNYHWPRGNRQNPLCHNRRCSLQLWTIPRCSSRDLNLTELIVPVTSNRATQVQLLLCTSQHLKTSKHNLNSKVC